MNFNSSAFWCLLVLLVCILNVAAMPTVNGDESVASSTSDDPPTPSKMLVPSISPFPEPAHYDLFDLDDVRVAVNSIIAKTESLGTGTEDLESFKGYLHRIEKFFDDVSTFVIKNLPGLKSSAVDEEWGVGNHGGSLSAFIYGARDYVQKVLQSIEKNASNVSIPETKKEILSGLTYVLREIGSMDDAVLGRGIYKGSRWKKNKEIQE